MTRINSVISEDLITKGVGVVGSGRMGIGIAYSFLVKGVPVQISTRDTGAENNNRIINKLLEGLSKGRSRNETMSDEAFLSNLEVVENLEFSKDPAVIIESAPENKEIKRDVIKAVASRHDSIIASNTSSISIAQLADEKDVLRRTIGMHFFNPVPASRLIEIIYTEDTLPQVVDYAHGISVVLGKESAFVKDSPGFASSRLGVALAVEAMRMLDEGVSDPRSIDNILKFGYGHAMGPLETTDYVGLDVRLGIAEYLEETLGDRFSPPHILRQKNIKKELGRKSGVGFYEWKGE